MSPRPDLSLQQPDGTLTAPAWASSGCGHLSFHELPEALRVLYAHQPRDEEALKQAYVDSGLDEVPDTFVLYRIIGNDLYPRHAKGQSRSNVKFILENEPALEGCEKRWVINRIVDEDERAAIIGLLEEYKQPYIDLPFDADDFGRVGWDLKAFGAHGFFSSEAFFELNSEQQDRAYTAAYRLKNAYLMHNNGARNAALRAGRDQAKWVLPWDGNCFLTQSAWRSLTAAITKAAHLRYFVVPMERVVDNQSLLEAGYSPCPVEEPQLIFRCDAPEEFNEAYPYGRRPKVELFWRHQIPGKWERWKDDPWDVRRRSLSPEAGQFGVAGWVARLFSGVSSLEAEDHASFKNRGLMRQQAIVASINHVMKRCNAEPDDYGLTSFRSEQLLALRELYRTSLADCVPEHPTVAALLQLAREALSRPPASVVDKTDLAPSGDPQDYFHPAPYWWPDPSRPDGLPFIKKDGQRVPGTEMYEPESDRYDRTRLQRLFDDSTTLALAAFLTDDITYAQHAANWLRRWFLDPSTRMNPHLRYSQVRMGRNGNEGYGRGIIETKDFYYYLDAVRLLARRGVLTPVELTAFNDWLQAYLTWLLQSPHGISECCAPNNHGTYYDLQVASIAAFLGDEATVLKALLRATDRIGVQFSASGVQYDEMTRTQSAHYCCYNLQGWLNLAYLARRYGIDLFGHKAANGATLEAAVRWVAAHLQQPWPYPQIEPFDDDRLFQALVYAEPLMRRMPILDSAPMALRPLAERKPLFHPHDGIRPFWNVNRAKP